jgi:hypothetical protein
MLVKRVFIDLKHYLYAGKKSFHRFKKLKNCSFGVKENTHSNNGSLRQVVVKYRFNL